MAARDDYPAEGGPLMVEMSTDDYAAAMVEIDALRAQSAVMDMMVKFAALGQALTEADITGPAVRSVVAMMDRWDRMAAEYANAASLVDPPVQWVEHRDLQVRWLKLADVLDMIRIETEVEGPVVDIATAGG